MNDTTALSTMAESILSGLRDKAERSPDNPYLIYDATALIPAILELKQAGLVEMDARGRLRAL